LKAIDKHRFVSLASRARKQWQRMTPEIRSRIFAVREIFAMGFPEVGLKGR
jgi:hypothetical protein